MKTDAAISVNGIIQNIATFRISEVVSLERRMQADTGREFPETLLRRESRRFLALAIRFACYQQTENYDVEMAIHGSLFSVKSYNCAAGLFFAA